MREDGILSRVEISGPERGGHKAACKLQPPLTRICILRLNTLILFSFINLISGSHQYKEPPQFLGGIIADPMGLGKTLTMIALVATDLQGLGFDEREIFEDEANNTTLIVVPPVMGCN